MVCVWKGCEHECTNAEKKGQKSKIGCAITNQKKHHWHTCDCGCTCRNTRNWVLVKYSVYRFTKAADVRAHPHTSIIVPLQACERDNVTQCGSRARYVRLKVCLPPPRRPTRKWNTSQFFFLDKYELAVDVVWILSPMLPLFVAFSLAGEGGGRQERAELTAGK